jgi:hypothetical protein
MARIEGYKESMAKVHLTPMFVTEIEGPQGRIQWQKGQPGISIVKQKQNVGRFAKEFRSRKLNPLLTTPNTLYADCDAWKAADTGYTNLNERWKAIWRRAIKVPGFSTYDAYMKQAIPHLLRGYPAPDGPDRTQGFPLKRLIYTKQYFHEQTIITFRQLWDQLGHPVMLPWLELQGWGEPPFIYDRPYASVTAPVSCHTGGVHFVGVDWRRAVRTPPFPWTPTYCLRMIIGFDDGGPHAPTNHWHYGTAYGRYNGFNVAMTWPLQMSGDETWEFDLYFKPTNVRVTILPDYRDSPDYKPRRPREPFTGAGTEVSLLDNKLNFTHWPRWWPSKKADATPRDLSWLKNWNDTYTTHYFPKEP